MATHPGQILKNELIERRIWWCKSTMGVCSDQPLAQGKGVYREENLHYICTVKIKLSYRLANIMLDTKTITIRIPVVSAGFLESIQGEDSLNVTIVRAIDRYQYLRAYSMEELRGKFTSDEWFFFLRATDRVIPEGFFRCGSDSLIACCKDAEKLDSTLVTDLGVDLNALADKVRKLTAAQIEAIYSRVEQRRLKGSSFDGWEYF